VFTGGAITKLKGAVSLQMVLRALIDEGLKRERGGAILANIKDQARAMRELRGRTRRLAMARRSSGARGRPSGPSPGPKGR
jgi:hypothetical protein